MTKISQPHDIFFRDALAQPEAAIGLLKKHLPEKILKLVDLKTLCPTKESFVEQDSSIAITDVLFKANIKQKTGYIYLLCEHQSTPDKLMPLRLMRYMISIMKHHVDHHKAKDNNILPAIIPIVFFNGQRVWSYSKNFFDLFGTQKDIMQDVILNDFHLVDFKTIPDEKLREEAWSGILALVMKHIFSKELLSVLETLRPLLLVIEKQYGGEYIVTVLKYIVEASKIEDKAGFLKFLESSLSKETGEKIMSLAEQWHNEGRLEGEQRGLLKGEQRGIEKGKLEGKLEGERSAKLAIARNLLSQDMGLDLVAQATDLPLDQIEQLKNEDLHK